MKAIKILILLPVIVLLELGVNAVFAQLDTAAPVISSVQVTNLTQTSATIAWRTDKASDSRVRFGASSEDLAHRVTSPAMDADHSVRLSGLSPNTRYLFEVQSTDASGNTAIDRYGGSLYSFITREARVVRRAFVGVVFDEPGKTVTLIQQGAGKQATITLPDSYSIETPGGPRAGTFQIGARVVILAERVDDNWAALRVLVKPVKPNIPVTGVVVRVDPVSLALIAPDGAQYAFSRSATDKELAAGDVVTVFRDNDARTTGLVKAGEVRGRLKQFLKNIADDDDDEEEPEPTEQLVNSLTRTLDNHGAQQLEIMNEVLEQAPEPVKQEIQSSKDRARAEIEESKVTVEQAKARSRRDKPEDSGDPPKENDNQDRDNDNQEAEEGRDKEDSTTGSPEEKDSPSDDNRPEEKEGQEEEADSDSDDKPNNEENQETESCPDREKNQEKKSCPGADNEPGDKENQEKKSCPGDKENQGKDNCSGASGKPGNGAGQNKAGDQKKGQDQKGNSREGKDTP